jgi:hypothetical protein
MGAYILQGGFSYKDYSVSKECSKLLNPDLLFPLQYSSFRNNVSTFDIDTRTFIVSLAVIK